MIRAFLLNEWGVLFNLTETQKGSIQGAGLYPQALSIIFFSLVIDRFGYGRTIAFAFIAHVASAIITESVLSFLGLGFPSDFPTWGKILFDSVDRMATFPERVIWPGLCISLTVLSVNYIGDGLRDALDPRIRGL